MAWSRLGEGPSAVLSVLAEVPLDLVGQFAAVTKADVLRVAQRYLTPDKLKVVVVGGRAKVMPQLEPLKLGPPDERDAWGTPVPTPKH